MHPDQPKLSGVAVLESPAREILWVGRESAGCEEPEAQTRWTDRCAQAAPLTWRFT